MTENELKKHLEEYKVTVDENAKSIAVQKAAEAADNRFVPMGIKDFILNQLHYIKLYYWILCLAYMITVPAAAAGTGQLKTAVWIGITTPLLCAFSVPGILSQFDSGVAELECSCLYRVSSVLYARLAIYGTASFLCILLSSAFTACFLNRLLWILLFETMMFMASALICLFLSFFIKNQYAAAVTVVLGIIFSFTIFSDNNIIDIEAIIPDAYISCDLMAAVIAVSAALLVLMIILFIKKHENKFDFHFNSVKD